jgi:hypothetical protein
VVPVGRRLYEQGGEELLRRLAKVHFKTTKKVLG